MPNDADDPIAVHRDEPPFGEHFDDVETLEHLAELGGMKAAATLIEDELRAKSPLRRVAELGISLAITVAIFARVIPQLVGVEYRDVLARLQTIDKATIAGLLAFWGFTMWNYAGVVTASLPGLTRLQAMVTNFAGSALANVVPFGGAAGVGGTYAQGLSKLGLPILVLAALLVTHQSSEGLSAAGLIGFAVLVASVVGLVMVFRSGTVAVRLGLWVQHALNLVRRLARRGPAEGLPERILAFRQRTVGLVSRRWPRLTLWMVAYKVSQATLQLLCAKAVGVEGVGWIQIFAVYAFGELLSTIPVTPSGVGFVEGGSAQLMVAFGAQPDAALAAVLFYRTFTYLLEIPLGAVGWLTWAMRTSWRKPAGTMTAALPD
jgi:uncharacterized membrane protein YbhN (UPF0104 family)